METENNKWNIKMLNKHFLYIIKPHTVSMTENNFKFILSKFDTQFWIFKGSSSYTSQSNLKFLVAISHFCEKIQIQNNLPLYNFCMMCNGNDQKLVHHPAAKMTQVNFSSLTSVFF